MKTNYGKMFKEGIITNNPVLVQLIGMCPILGVSTSLANGLGMGMAVVFVLMCSNAVVSALRKFIPAKIRIACYIVIIAGFVSVIDMLIKAFVPALASSLGLFIPLIVVNCLILARAEAFAGKNSVLPSVVDGLTMGLGFTFAISTLGLFREIFGSGTITVWGELQLDLVDTLANIGIDFHPAGLVTSAPGAFIMLGVFVAIVQQISMIAERKKGTK